MNLRRKGDSIDKSILVLDAFLAVIFCLVLALVICLMTGCSPKIVEVIHTEYRDSTIIKEVTKDSLVYVPIPLESHQVIVDTRDTSRLETSVAKSEAYVTGNGFLRHSLENKREKLPAIVPITNKIVYSGVMQSNVEIRTITKEVEKPLSWGQRFRLGAFWWLLGGLILALLWIFRKFIF